MVVTPEGFPLAYEVMPGNTADKTTLRGFLEKIQTRFGKARRIWINPLPMPFTHIRTLLLRKIHRHCRNASGRPKQMPETLMGVQPNALLLVSERFMIQFPMVAENAESVVDIHANSGEKTASFFGTERPILRTPHRLISPHCPSFRRPDLFP